MAIQKITADVIANSAVTADSLADTTITAAKLHTTLDLTGKTVTVATASAGDNDTTVASTAFVSTAIANLADSAPSTLNTLNELAAALGDDANFSTTVTNSIALKAPLASPTFTGDATFDTSTLVVDATNNRVGIGTTSPLFPLHISSSSTDVAKFQTSGSYAYTRFQNSSKTWALSVGSSFGFYDEAASATRMVIDSSGNVGIGTTSPAQSLDTTGKIRIRDGGNTTIPSIQMGASGVDGLSLPSTNTVAFITNSTERMRINAAGGLSINDNVENPLSLNRTTTTTGASYMKFTNAGGNYYIGADSSAGDRMAIGGLAYGFTMTAESGRPLVFATSNTARMTIDSSGNVGIGTTSPVEKLHVEGSMMLDAYNVGAEEGLFLRQGFSSSNKYNLGIMTYAHNGSTNDGLTIGAYNGFSVCTGSNSRQERMRINSSGNVGIGTDSISNLLQVAGAIGLNHAAMNSGATTGDFSVTVSGLTTLSGSAWKQMGFLVFYAGVDGTLAGSNMFLSMIRLRGLSTYASAVQSNIVGTATISDSSASSTGLTINFDVGNSNQGSVYVLLLGGHGNRPSITISG